MRHITARTALALLAAAALTACGAEPGADPSGDAPTRAETTAAETSQAEPTEAEPTGPVAADGTDYAACADGACEVAVAEPADIEVGDALPFSVTAVTDEGIEFAIVAEGASVGGSLPELCELSAIGASFQSWCPDDPSELTDPAPAEDELLVQLLGIDADGAAVLRFTLG